MTSFRRILPMTHYGKTRSWCGIAIGFHVVPTGTLNRALVTCRNCLRAMKASERRDAAVRGGGS
jgi:hypothetical protein